MYKRQCVYNVSSFNCTVEKTTVNLCTLKRHPSEKLFQIKMHKILAMRIALEEGHKLKKDGFQSRGTFLQTSADQTHRDKKSDHTKR